MTYRHRVKLSIQGIEHIVKIKTWKKGEYVEFEISSTPMYVKVDEYTTENIDIDKDGADDLAITVNGIYSSYADVSFNRLHAAITAVQPKEPVIEESLPRNANLPQEALQPVEPVSEPEKTEVGLDIPKALIFIAVGFMVGLIIFTVMINKKKISK